jgi:hypothetical protein
VTTVVLLFALLQDNSCRGEAARHIVDAMRLAQVFELAGAASSFESAVKAGCRDVEVDVFYLRGLVAARAANAQFGSEESLRPAREAASVLERRSKADLLARAAHSVVRAAIAAAQHERAEMSFFIDEMLRLESVQLEAGLPGLPGVTAHEAAGDFWLQQHAWNEATRAFDVAAQRIGRTPFVLLGLARAAAGRRDARAACESYKELLAWWANRSEPPPEIVEAQAFVKQPPCAPPAPRRPAAK